MQHDYTPKDEARFWSKVDRSPHPKNCWLWTAGKFRKGYGAFTLNYHTVKAHRFSYRLAHGKFPDALFVLHSCDNTTCVNPEHLSLGTTQDNMDDMVVKKRQSKGERQHSHKLTTAQVREVIRRWAAGGITQTALAAEYEVAQQSISAIVNGEHWKHL